MRKTSCAKWLFKGKKERTLIDIIDKKSLIKTYNCSGMPFTLDNLH